MFDALVAGFLFNECGFLITECCLLLFALYYIRRSMIIANEIYCGNIDSNDDQNFLLASDVL